MRKKSCQALLIGALVNLGCLLAGATAEAQVNTWTNLTSGASFNWEDAASWSLGVPPASGQDIYITNAASVLPSQRVRVVNIDATTSGSFPSTMTINSLTILGPRVGSFNNFNTLALNNAGTATPLQIANGFTLTTRGSLFIANSALQMPLFSRGTPISLFDDGNILLESGSLTADVIVGNTGTGIMSVSNGMWEGTSA